MEQRTPEVQVLHRQWLVQAEQVRVVVVQRLGRVGDRPFVLDTSPATGSPGMNLGIIQSIVAATKNVIRVGE